MCLFEPDGLPGNIVGKPSKLECSLVVILLKISDNLHTRLAHSEKNYY